MSCRQGCSYSCHQIWKKINTTPPQQNHHPCYCFSLSSQIASPKNTKNEHLWSKQLLRQALSSNHHGNWNPDLNFFQFDLLQATQDMTVPGESSVLLWGLQESFLEIPKAPSFTSHSNRPRGDCDLSLFWAPGVKWMWDRSWWSKSLSVIISGELHGYGLELIKIGC